MKYFNKFVLTSFVLLCLLSISLPNVVNAAADIAINNAKITSANTVLVTFNDPGHNLASVDYTKWHIDQTGGGVTPLDPTSATVTSAGTPWTVTLTFSGTPFSDTATAFSAASGLYVEASGVTDTNGDTNAVVAHDASIAIADSQTPTFTAARTALNTIALTFSETVDASDTATAAWTVAGATVSAATDPENTTTLTLTTTGLTSTSSTPAVTYVAASGTVVDASAAHNEVANGATANAADQVPPTFTAARTALNTIVLTFSENVNTTTTAGEGYAVAGATVTANTDPAGTSTSMTLTTTGLTSTSSTPAVTYTRAAGTTVDASAAANEVANAGTANAADQVPPTLEITLSDYIITYNQTSTVTFTFSEEPTGFANADVTVENGTLSTVTVDGGDAKIYTATLTPTNSANDETNIVTVGTSWTDSAVALNAPVGSTVSANYTIDTERSSGGGGTSSKKKTTTPATVAPAQTPTTSGQVYSNPSVAKFVTYVNAKTGKTSIKNLQAALNTVLAGKLSQLLVVDGIWGPKTLAAVKTYQATNGLVADGKFGPISLAKMNSLLGL